MRWLKRMLRNWAFADGSLAAAPERNPGLLGALSSVDNPTAVQVIPIRNGFLIANRRYNPSGPDLVTAVFAADADTLSTMLVAEMAMQRLTQK